MQDVKKVIEYYKQAHEAGSDLAANNLGSLYLWSRPNADVDYKKASQWFGKAKFTSPAAQFSLGYMYLHGLYFKMDLNKALEYFIKPPQGG